MSQFELNKTDENRYKSLEAMLSARQLLDGLDSLTEVRRQIEEIMSETVRRFVRQEVQDSTQSNKISVSDKNSSNTEPSKISVQEQYSSDNTMERFRGVKKDSSYSSLPDSLHAAVLTQIPRSDWGQILSRANGIATSRYNSLRSASFKTERLARSTAKHYYELNTKFSTALMCLIFVLIGAPMGAIIRKGGYGYPLLVSIIFFMLYIVLFILTGQLSKSLTMNPILAAWLPNLVLLPIGVFLSYKAAQDSKFDMIQRWAAALKIWFKKS
jgi:lipopolysaccharide export system permease protein